MNETPNTPEKPREEISGSPSPRNDQCWVQYQFGKHFVRVGEVDPDPTRYAQRGPLTESEIEALMNQEPLPEGWTEYSEHETAFQKVKRQMTDNQTD